MVQLKLLIEVLMYGQLDVMLLDSHGRYFIKPMHKDETVNRLRKSKKY